MSLMRALPLLLAAGMMACSSPSPVDEIIDSNIAARGGYDLIRKIDSLRATGTATASGGRVARVVYELKRGGLFRLEFSSQGLTSVFAHDNEGAWEVDPLDGQFEPRRVTPETDSPMGIGERDIESHFVDWEKKQHRVELLGQEQLAGGEAFKIKTILEDGTIRHDYIDVATRQIVRSDIPRRIRGRDTVVVDTFSDFRETEGLVLPHLVETRVEGRPEVITIVVDGFEINPELDNARFQYPD
jgi:hypothetical protein